MFLISKGRAPGHTTYDTQIGLRPLATTSTAKYGGSSANVSRNRVRASDMAELWAFPRDPLLY